MKSDYMQYIAENEPDYYQNGNSPGDHLKGPDTVDPIGIVAIIRDDGVISRAFRAGFLTFGFFLALFHGIKWEETL